MKDKLFMNYGRNHDDDSFTGDIWLEAAPTRGRILLCTFNRWTFSRMMSNLASEIRELKEVEVILSRTEKPLDQVMDNSLVEQLRTDPAAAIQAMSPPHRVVKRAPKTEASAGSKLRAGHDTLADAFGDDVYLQRRADDIECPGCGRWTLRIGDSYSSKEHWAGCACGMGLIVCLEGKWAYSDTMLLLDQPFDRYFIPRKWNESGSWISHGDLKKKFEDFKQERDHVRT